MPIPTGILFIRALFTLALAVAGWWVAGWWSDPGAPPLGPRFVAELTEGGLWTGPFLFLMAVGDVTRRGQQTVEHRCRAHRQAASIASASNPSTSPPWSRQAAR
ncbi:hypothetical protein Q8W71_15435 [Methylobacterium sp. NEAU 140]|uniref:hypothetical protein n=1 Tax=Methylobacterium sp. NEAU 140 TaxID=3064945 RepID=UPI0027364E7C|nr:hypothetical protein [Methylobacterium sp. NEAU 140]MDP4024022.1 hypothetical protein [Methylobacterium sp. NEAU 140]